ncbi:MAG: enoyl-CoA hydratase-related protein [Acidimicrobiales bacterium]
MSDADFEHLRFERDGDVLVVTIDRAGDDLNRIDERLHHELTALFPRLQRERDARAVLLTGAGRAFSAGGDFAWFPALQQPGRLEHLRLDAKALIWDLLDVAVPIVCALNGSAMGLGASIALLCDAVFMADSATIGDPHVRVGIVAGDGGTVAWPLALGPVRAKRWLLTGDPVPAGEAATLGLITEAVPDHELMDRARAFAHRLAAGAPLAVQGTKAAVNASIKDALGRSFDLATALEIGTFHSADHGEALAALAEKRAPRFTGT